MPTANGLLKRFEIPEFLEARGFKISKQTLDNLSRPSCNGGPPAEGRWCKFYLYDPAKVLAWAEALFKAGVPRQPKQHVLARRARRKAMRAPTKRSSGRPRPQEPAARPGATARELGLV
jgi:hypothetical protein